MADQDAFDIFTCQSGHFHMHFGHQGTGGIKDGKPTPSSQGPHRLRYTVRAVN